MRHTSLVYPHIELWRAVTGMVWETEHQEHRNPLLNYY